MAWQFDFRNGNQSRFPKESPEICAWAVRDGDSSYLISALSETPLNPTNDRGASILVGGHDIVSYKSKVDDGDWSLETTIDQRIILTDLTDGVHSVHVVGKNSMGLWQDEELATEITWVVDTVAPPPPLASGHTPSGDSTPSWTWSSGGDGGNGTFRYKVNDDDLASDATVTRGLSYEPESPLAEGPNTLYVQERDDAGNWSATASFTVFVDTIAPQVTGLLDDAVPAKNKTWAWDAVDATTVHFRYAIDQSPSWESPSGEYSETKTATKSTGDGAWYLHVQARDAAGNVSEVVTVSAVLDNTPPTATLTGTPASPTGLNNATFTVAGADVVAYKWKVDAGPYSEETPVASQITLTGLVDGPHSVEVLGQDPAGNWQSTASPSISTWTVDTSPPAIIGLSDDPAPVRSKTWVWTADEPASFRFSIDEEPAWDPVGIYSPLAVSVSLTAGAEGTWYLHVQAKDELGHESQVLTVSVILDRTAPVVTGLSDDTGPVRSKTWSWGAADADHVITYRYLIDQNASWEAPSGDWFTETAVTKSTGDGPWYLHVQAKDRAGNKSEVRTVSVLLDNTAPVVGIERVPDKDLHNGDYTIAISSDDGEVEYREGTGPWVPYVGPFLVAEEGTHSYEARSTDLAGNVGIAGPANFTIDKTPPATPTLDAVISPTNMSPQSVSGTRERNSSVWLNGSQIAGLEDSEEWSHTLSLTEGVNVLHLTSRDAAENQSEPLDAEIVFDVTPPGNPMLESSNPEAEVPTNDRTVDLVWLLQPDNLSGTAGYSWVLDLIPDTVPDQEMETGLPLTLSLNKGDAVYFLHVRTRDNAGNWSFASHYGPWPLDTVPPVAILVDAPQGVLNVASVSIVVRGEDVTHYSYRLDGGNYGPAVPVGCDIQLSQLLEGEHTIYVIAKDSAGNWQPAPEATTANWVIDLLPGDINADGKIDLTDAVVASQIVGGVVPMEGIHLECELVKNGRIGLEEVVYALQAVGELRPPQ